MYHIFEVSDYKGGELHHSLNLSEDELIDEIIETLGLDDFTKEALSQALDSEGEDCIISPYAGGGDYVMEIFKSEGNKLVPVSWAELIPKIANR